MSTVDTLDVGATTMVYGWIFTALAILSFSLLIRTKFRKRIALGQNDCCLFLALVLSVALVAQTT